MKCADCQWKYPDRFLSEMYAYGNYTEPICGICALVIANKVSGVDRTQFLGEEAELMRQSAIRWRRDHPADAPSVN